MATRCEPHGGKKDAAHRQFRTSSSSRLLKRAARRRPTTNWPKAALSRRAGFLLPVRRQRHHLRHRHHRHHHQPCRCVAAFPERPKGAKGVEIQSHWLFVGPLAFMFTLPSAPRRAGSQIGSVGRRLFALWASL